jgi:hypothetical protein
MLGIQYIKAGPTQYIIHFRNGKIRRAGTGLAFFYYKPASSIAVVPVGSIDAPFIFNEMTADFQPVTVQGQLTYHIDNPELVASLLNYTVDTSVDLYLSEDPDKLPQRLVNLAQVLVRTEVLAHPLRTAILSADEISFSVLEKFKQHETLQAWGVEVLDLAILEIRPTPEIAKALEAESREALLRASDEAIYERRNAAVEQERRIKENELNTEIAVEEKQRQIRETKVEADLAVEKRQQEVREEKLRGQVALEEEREQLVTAQAENMRVLAEAKTYDMEAMLRPLRALNPETLQLLAVQSADPRRMVSMALKQLGENAGKIGQLTITPELLTSLMRDEL